MIGQTVGHYEVEERLGGGGMGVVYRARDLKLGRAVALKFLSPHLVTSDRAKQRFIAEARAASALDHPAIATIHAIEETKDGELYIVMAYYEGETIAARLARRGAIPVGPTLELALQAADGLARAHEQGVVHRDVKPANLMVTAEERVKVLDFGLAKREDVRLTDAGTTLGTPAYMSPEQARGSHVDHRTDIWSFGVVLYEMLTARLPFTGEERDKVLDAVLHADAEPPSRFTSVPPELDAVVLRALARAPGARHPTMAALASELRAVRQTRLGATSADTLVGPAHSTAGSPATKGSSGAAAATTPSGERRFVTVLACDVAEILSLSEGLDPEELREVLERCHQLGAAVVRGLEGHLAKADEGRLVAYFGYPVAHEDDAQRAVRAALAIADALARPDAPRGARGAPLTPRSAIHTGLMVAGDSRASGAGLVGNAPAIATRLLEGARAGTVVVSADARPLVERLYELEPAGEQSLPGMARPVTLARVVRESAAETSGIARAALTPLVGRQEDLALLVARFELAREGHGQALLVTGEPGIGKSRLLVELNQRLRGEPHLLLECRSSPYHTSDALRPLVDMLSRLAGLEESHTADEKRERLGRALEPAGATPETVALLADALSLPPDAARSPLELSPQKRKQKTLEALLQLVLGAAARKPVLLVVEDLHWLDPSSDEVLDALVRQATGAAVLVIATARPGTSPAWADEEHVTRLALRRLSRQQVEHLVERIAGRGVLPGAIVEQVLSRTDGIPLFAEELTRAVCDAVASQEGAGTAVPASLASIVPATLQESLAARLDRLGSVKGTAQLAAVLGREFPLVWLEAVSPLAPDALRDELEKLVESGLLQPRGPAPAASFLFKHALVQEAAYASLLKTTRQQYHERTARALEERFPETAAAQPHLLAHHHTEAGHAPVAIGWWARAAQRAGERFASREAVASLRRALELLPTLPEGPQRDAQELGLQMGLCALVPSVSGYTSAETEQAYLRAQELCDRAGRVADNFFVHHGLWAFHLVCGRLAGALERARALHEAAGERGDTLSVVDGHYALGCTLADVGEPEAALRHLEAGMAADAAEPGRAPSYHAGMELGITTPSFSVMLLFLLGRPDAALERARLTADKARALGHPLSLAFALYYVAWAHMHRGEATRTAETAREIVKLSEEHGLFFAPLGAALLGWALDQEASLVAAWRAPRLSAAEVSPAADEDFDRVATSLRLYRGSGAMLNVPFMLWLVALGHARRRRFAEARASVDEALRIAADTGETWWSAELLRLGGELALAAAGAGAALAAARGEAAAAFLSAREVAAGQKALSLELRAAASLARLRKDEGRKDEARAALAPVLGRFGEGRATGDLVAAQALAAELA
ncbi:MAG TPA: protein kinase [Vicinamibacteria bacterium]|jgi:class 3 adenylate cyclase/tetratricopeptide (TPR) repeat protein